MLVRIGRFLMAGWPVMILVLGAVVLEAASELPADDARLASVFVAPPPPWRPYAEPKADDFLGVHPFAAFQLPAASGASQTVELYTSPSVPFDTGFTLGCSTEMSVSFTFDAAGRLTAIEDSPEKRTCP